MVPTSPIFKGALAGGARGADGDGLAIGLSVSSGPESQATSPTTGTSRSAHNRRIIETV
jgi:hypothetical protein